jgi:5'(3')-deoxyribonucleotidase
MVFKPIQVFVEGPNDKLFFDKKIKPLFPKRDIRVSVYCGQDHRVKPLLKKLAETNERYIVVGDLDTSPCITSRKQAIKNRFPGIKDKYILIVIKEIEGWYLAGAPKYLENTYNLKVLPDTNKLVKEDFKKIVESSDFSDIEDAFAEILKYFNIDLAKRRNKSFKHFLDNLGCYFN